MRDSVPWAPGLPYWSVGWMVKAVGTPAMTALGSPRTEVCSTDSAAGPTVNVSGDCTAGIRVWACVHIIQLTGYLKSRRLNCDLSLGWILGCMASDMGDGCASVHPHPGVRINNEHREAVVSRPSQCGLQLLPPLLWRCLERSEAESTQRSAGLRSQAGGRHLR